MQSYSCDVPPLIAHRNPSSHCVRGWFPGFGTVHPDHLDTFPGFLPSGTHRDLQFHYRCGGQRRHSTGFPIIHADHSRHGTLNIFSRPRTNVDNGRENDTSAVQRRQSAG